MRNIFLNINKFYSLSPEDYFRRAELYRPAPLSNLVPSTCAPPFCAAVRCNRSVSGQTIQSLYINDSNLNTMDSCALVEPWYNLLHQKPGPLS